MIVKMIQNLRKIMEKMQDILTEDLEELKNKQKEMRNTLEIINSRKTEAEEWIRDLEDRMVEITAARENVGKKSGKNEVRDLWDNSKCTNILIIGVSEGEEWVKVPEKTFKRTVGWKLP